MNRFFLLLLALITLSSIGCKNDTGSIGLNLKDRNDLLGALFSDSTQIFAYSVLEHSIPTKNLATNVLGLLKDPVFGTTEAGIYTQLLLSGNSVNFGTNPRLDSIVLTLRYSGGYYGDTLNPFTVRVYELSEEISSSESYYQYSTREFYPLDLCYGEITQVFAKPKSKITLDTIYDAHLRIRLSDDLGNKFLENSSQMSTSDKFKQFFKGLYICAENTKDEGCLVYFSLINSLSGIQLHYSNDEGTKKKYSFVITNPNAHRFNEYKHNYELGSAQFVQQVKNCDTTLGSVELYTQSMGGVKTKLSFPTLRHLKNQRIVINKAELIITNCGDNSELYPAPAKLALQAIDKKSKKVFLPDDAVYTNATYYGGNYVNTSKEYRFRITRYVQDLILRDNYLPYIYIVSDGASVNANRLHFIGTEPNNLKSRIRLELYYTKY